MRRTVSLFTVALVLTTVACVDDPTSRLEPSPTDEVVRPTSVQSVALDVTSFAMPESWDASESWHVAVHPDGRILAGGAGGLFLLGEPTLQLDDAPVRGLLADVTLGFLVVTDAALKVYDLELFDSALNQALSGLRVMGVVRRGSQMWLVTDAELHAFDGVALASYPDLVGVASLRTNNDSPYLVAQDTAGLLTLLREDDGVLGAQDLNDELDDIVLAAPGPRGRVFALAGETRLFERLEVAGGVAWQPVALTIDPADQGADGVGRIIADPVGGALWITRDTSLSRIDGGGVTSTFDWPSAISSAGHIVATSDGAIWMSEASQLVRVGPAQPPPSYVQHVLPWYDDNCARCHEEGGEVATVTRFGDYDSFAALIDIIADQAEEGLMPLGESALVGDAELPRRWREGGMRP